MYCWPDVARRTAAVYDKITGREGCPCCSAAPHAAAPPATHHAQGQLQGAGSRAQEGLRQQQQQQEVQAAQSGGTWPEPAARGPRTRTRRAHGMANGHGPAGGDPANSLPLPPQEQPQGAAAQQDGCCAGGLCGACSEAEGYRRATRGGELLSRLARFRQCGLMSGLVYGAIALAVHLWWCLLQWLQPAHGVEVAVDWPVGGGAAAGAQQEHHVLGSTGQ